MNTKEIIDDIIRREGGYVNDSADRGGATKYGITEAVARKHGYSGDMRDLSEDKARQIYMDDYVVSPRFNEVHHPALAALLVDSGVQHGTKRAAKWLQEAVGVAADGVVGGITLSAVNAADGGDLYRKILGMRARFYGRIVTGNPTQARFSAGWNNRLAEFIEATP